MGTTKGPNVIRKDQYGYYRQTNMGAPVGQKWVLLQIDQYHRVLMGNIMVSCGNLHG